MINLKSIKTQLNLFLAVFGLFLYAMSPSASLLSGLLWGLFFTILIEAVVLYFKTRKFQITASAITSGFIIGYVLAADSPWWMFLAVAASAMVLKHLIKFRGKNVFNPAALSIFLAVLFLKGYTEWKGAYTWYVLIPAGLYIVHKIRKMELVLGYFGMSFLLFIPQALIQHTPLIDVFGYFNYFFIFIMMVEPKTTPPTFWPKLVFGAGVALLIFALTEFGFRYEPELFALLVFNALVPLFNKIPNWKFRSVVKS